MDCFASAFTSTAPTPELTQWVAQGWDTVRATVPGVSLDGAVFFELVGRLAHHDVEAARALNLPDLYLARAALSGDRHALDLLDQILHRASSVLHPLGDADFRGEVVQRTRLRLVLKQGTREPRLEAYLGSGPLLNWVRSVLYRAGVSFRRRDHAQAGPGALANLEDNRWAADLLFLKVTDRRAFARAFRKAFAMLSPRDQGLLQANAVDRVSIDRLAELHQVHRATAARWVEHAKSTLRADVELRLKESLDLDDHELARVMSSLATNLDVSLTRLVNDGTKRSGSATDSG